MTSDLQIKQFELSEREALLSFLRRAYPGEPHKSDPAFWEWHFLKNPHVSPGNIPIWIVKCGDTIVGQVASTPVELKLGDEIRPAVWSADYYLLPEYRRGGLALRLFRAFERYCPTALNLGYNEKAAAVIRGLKWKFLGKIHRYHVLLFPGNASQSLLRLAPVRLLANFLYAPLRPHVGRRSNSAACLVSEVTEFDSAFDRLWQESSAQWQCAVVRSSRFLRWQFMQQPRKKYTVLGCFEKDRLRGYIILYFKKGERGAPSPKASISDLCYSPENSLRVIDCLLKGALRLAVERRAGALVTDVLDERVEKSLRQLGFWRIQASPPFAAKTTVCQDLVYEPGNWFLTRGDSDVSIFEEPNL